MVVVVLLSGGLLFWGTRRRGRPGKEFSSMCDVFSLTWHCVCL